jgi:hypothetical protein
MRFSATEQMTKVRQQSNMGDPRNAMDVKPGYRGRAFTSDLSGQEFWLVGPFLPFVALAWWLSSRFRARFRIFKPFLLCSDVAIFLTDFNGFTVKSTVNSERAGAASYGFPGDTTGSLTLSPLTH